MTTSASRFRRATEQGQVTIFGIGLVLMILVVGGLSLDLWRVVAERRALGEVAGAAAAAGSNGVDVQHFRETGNLRLDPAVAHRYAVDNLASQSMPVSFVGVGAVRAEPDRITVVVTGRVDFVLLSLIDPGGGVELRAEVGAGPRRSLQAP